MDIFYKYFQPGVIDCQVKADNKKVAYHLSPAAKRRAMKGYIIHQPVAGKQGNGKNNQKGGDVRRYNDTAQSEIVLLKDEIV
jgi:hypothetical protein